MQRLMNMNNTASFPNSMQVPERGDLAFITTELGS